MGAVALREDTGRPQRRRVRSHRADWDDSAWQDAQWHEVAGRPQLRVVIGDGDGGDDGRRALAAGSRRRAVRRRRWAVLAVVAVLTGVLTVLVADPGASAGAGTPAHEHAVIEPGQTLWQVATEHAPPGTDPRAYLDRLRQLNGLDGTVAAWTVVLLPAE